MTLIYQFAGASGWEPARGSAWEKPGLSERYLDCVASPMDAGWELPELEWIHDEPPPDLSAFMGAPILDVEAHPDLAEWFSMTGQFEELAGDANGLRLVRFPERTDIGFDLASHPRRGPGRLSVDLPEGIVGFCGAAIGLNLVSVEEPAGPGFRHWVREQETTGLRFKKIWDSEDDTVLYDPRWGMNALRDPSILD